MQVQDLIWQFRVPELGDFRQYVRSLPTNTLMGMGAFAAITTYWYATRPRALKPPCDLTMQSVEVEGEEYVRRSILLDSDRLMTHFYDDARTMYEVFLRGIRVSNNGPCLGSRKPKQPYEWLSYKEVADRAEMIGSALLHRGHSKAGDKYIGIFSQNRPEWTISELACYTYSLVAVPLYDTLGTEAISYIIDQAEISTVICDVVEKVCTVLECVSGREHSVKTIVLMEEKNSELNTRAEKEGIQIISLRELEALGKAYHRRPVPPSPEDLALICFTSGTTGNPKGAMLTHGNVISNCAAFIRITQIHCMLNHTDIHVSYLPLAHMFERVVESVILVHGARIGYFQGDIRMLMDDLKTLKPTVFPVVPRLLNRMFDKIFGQANTPLKRWLLDFATRRKESELRSGIVRKDSMWDKLIFNKVQVSLGGRVRLMITGAAPVSPTVLTFLRAALGCQFYEGYGQTECTAGCSMSLPGDWTAGHVGPPLPCNYVKLLDVAEMSYYAANGEGEVCVKGPNVFHGYLKDPEKTAEAIDIDGWLHTGDIGKWLPNGTLKIIDRKKHIFKLAQGEYIAPEKIENIYIHSDPVAQVFVHGDSLQACLVGIVVPDPDILPGWAKKRGLVGSYHELCKSKEVKNAILEDLMRLGKEGGLKSFEQVRDIALNPEMFSVKNGLLTPTLKAKRTELRSHFKEQINQLYATIKM
ncbi:long-chain-fatty-acid--CoA ligase 1a isoform X2 [Pangasianodon hypophthalmus]|uniref:long-chain-fatty-acid--CoA ligase 1a isoform X2 n=1 Tax=Pangasianodon hypophthalmus TaxID=310915 RepID=UPI000EFFD366|nr:long-chain-fatty-acid--CoA ligase 1a isoform X2 [Pangasianodon hypophthalmus]XP_026803482.3 long-chain-fatty-acid--CoA ligase 1a isoform X2 [Pangasianodon hypophthalmus]XP_026803483.3 long-chain-fatty-acid--CoA ligase 1a isoform X2 [Pangasianodon hypophthalmus]XP_034157105.2 long-chain-fatty-acid--CoA ligase 1a isoform X2 [Pangasianodon hypophthalmus]XP_053086945.1 long-chain-fatty-acid--CoA ligase 1a isoform X2 [Pangasianodon hypophthalmus]XP_053086946.1 long-chain-fatty-acid--CoA ligase 1